MNDIIIRKNGSAGHITLNRPKKLNPLSHDMALKIEAALFEWANNDKVRLIMIDATGEKAFCAGGDVNLLYSQGMAGDFDTPAKFWRDEYRLNALIANYEKPFVAIMNGIVMGGGVGISAHGSHRIVTENTRLALPECSIGLIPDVGSTHLLAQAPGYLGEFLALTGHRLSSSEAIYCGFADYYVPSERLENLKNALSQTGDISKINEFTEASPHNELTQYENEINDIFCLPDLTEIISRLASSQSSWASDALRSIKRASPLCCKITFDLVRELRRSPGVANALKHEYRFVSRVMQHGDFLEGVRAAIIDKDRAPNWKYSSFDLVPANILELFYKPAENGDITQN